MNTYADDLATLVEKLELKIVIHVAHSTGGGEVARYLGRHGTKNVAKACLFSIKTFHASILEESREMRGNMSFQRVPNAAAYEHEMFRSLFAVRNYHG